MTVASLIVVYINSFTNSDLFLMTNIKEKGLWETLRDNGKDDRKKLCIFTNVWLLSVFLQILNFQRNFRKLKMLYAVEYKKLIK